MDLEAGEQIHLLALKYHWERDTIVNLTNIERMDYLRRIIRDAEEEKRMYEEAQAKAPHKSR